jgi:hypothetical protein
VATDQVVLSRTAFCPSTYETSFVTLISYEVKSLLFRKVELVDYLLDTLFAVGYFTYEVVSHLLVIWLLGL